MVGVYHKRSNLLPAYALMEELQTAELPHRDIANQLLHFAASEGRASLALQVS